MRLSEIEDTENLNKFIFDFKEKYTNKKLVYIYIIVFVIIVICKNMKKSPPLGD